MGLFLRGLSSLYAIIDCERFVDEMIDRTVFGLPTDLPEDHCRFALDDVRRILSDVPAPRAYKRVVRRVGWAEAILDAARDAPNRLVKIRRLRLARMQLAITRRIIATTPELPM